MKRPGIIRFQLLLLAVVTLLVIWRSTKPPPPPDGLIVYSGIEPGRLLEEAFRVEQPVQVVIDATGSFESEEQADSISLAAYGWVLRREDRTVVWSMHSAPLQKGDNTLALVTDTVEFQPGVYDVYFASYGNEDVSSIGLSLLDGLLDLSVGDGHFWRNDADKWQMVVRTLGDTLAPPVHLDTASPVFLPGEEELLWTSAPMEGGETAEYLFRVIRPAEMHVYAVGEIGQERMDFGWIEEVSSGERVWDMRRENTVPAGGWEVNRLFDGTVSLPPGLYRTVFRTDPRQDYGDWVRNPPLDPAGWGVSLFTTVPQAVRPFDPWEDQEPFIRINRVGDSERHIARFRVRAPAQVAVYALGEMGDDDRYDYARITAGRSERVLWEMTPERSLPAGGYNNRRELAFLNLQPGIYTAIYQTDDSHSYAGWSHGEPDHPERWGVTLFHVDRGTDPSAIEVLTVDREAFIEVPDSEEDSVFAVAAPTRSADRTRFPGEGAPGAPLVDLTGLGNRERLSAPFTFDGEGFLRIRAVGEMSFSEQYDYGWIEHAETGETVWEMIWQNTIPAGGDERNRMFLGTLSLAPGAYTAHFRTDFSHAYGDFSDIPPNDPGAWGIRVFASRTPEESEQ